MKKQYLLITIFSLIVQFANAQFTLDGEFRPRTELRNGFGNIIADGTDAGFGISTRVRLNAGYKTDSYKFYMSLQDVLTWGENRQILPIDANDSFGVFQAWAELKLAPGFSTKLGRQVLSYDDQRLLGGLGWAQQARNHDAALFKYKTDTNFKIDIALAFNQDKAGLAGFSSTGTEYSTTGVFSYKTMQLAHISKKWDDLYASLIIMNNGFQNSDAGFTDVENLQTFGTHLKYSKSGITAAANLFYQNGDALYNPATGPVYKDVKGAYLASLDLGYKVSDKVTLGLGGEIISGNDEDAATDTGSFFPLYGTNHKFNGFMDYFYVGNHANSIGLVDIHASAVIKTGAKSSLLVKALNFSGQQELASGEKALGTEVDLVFTQKFKGYALKLGYSQMFASDGLYEVKGTTADASKNIQNWAWAMLIIKPKFLNGAKKGMKGKM